MFGQNGNPQIILVSIREKINFYIGVLIYIKPRWDYKINLNISKYSIIKCNSEYFLLTKYFC